MTAVLTSSPFVPKHSSAPISRSAVSRLATVFVAAISTAALTQQNQSELDEAQSQLYKQIFTFASFKSSAPTNTGVKNAALVEMNISKSTKSESKTVDDILPQWTQQSLNRIDHLAALEAGWAGPTYESASTRAIIDAERFLLKLSHLGLELSPAIGLDDDGSISIHISKDDLSADLSIHDDGTYSYFAEVGLITALSDGSPIDGNIDDELIKLLTS